MTRKHYAMLAQWCGQSNVSDFRVETLMELLEEDNPKFDKNKFRKKFLEHRDNYETYNRGLIARLRA
jgi:hypothetical protein